jgi:hypothetical protein
MDVIVCEARAGGLASCKCRVSPSLFDGVCTEMLQLLTTKDVGRRVVSEHAL